MASHKPDGYSALSPYLIVDDPGRLTDWFKELFQARELRRLE